MKKENRKIDNFYLNSVCRKSFDKLLFFICMKISFNVINENIEKSERM